MSSSFEEIIEPIQELIKKGYVGIDINSNQKQENKHIKYNEPTTDLFSVFTQKEIDSNLQSNLIKEALEKKLNVIEYYKKVVEEKKKIAIEQNELILVDIVGLLDCVDPREECNWDIVYEYVSPEGKIFYTRNHVY